MANRQDKDLELYRDLVEQPTEFEEGFNLKTVIGALLLGLLITPGSIYIFLVAGEGIGPAARWVTIFLFAEVAKRSLKDLRQQETFILYYMTGSMIIASPAMMGPLWYIFCAQSDAFQAMGLAQHMPDWVVPEGVRNMTAARTLFTAEWLPALGLFAVTMLITRIDYFGLGYILYRITNDVERLPFPMAPIGASGILAMAETKDKSQQWRSACFAIGGVIGLLFGVVYIGIPALTGVVFREPVFLIPIPWIELTPTFKDILPATAVNIVPNLARFLMGMVLPFWAIVGGFVGLIITMVLNPTLYKYGILHTWKPGMQTVDTLFSNQIDFYLSFGLGISFFIALLGILQALGPLFSGLFRYRKEAAEAEANLTPGEFTGWQRLMRGNPARNDISLWLSVAIYIASTCSYIGLATYLVPGFPWPIFLIYGFVYTPVMGYAAARVEGLAGQSLAIPYVKESAFILSGYKGLAIWYVPIPIHNYGFVTKDFRIIELTGTKITSALKTELICIPILILSMIVFSSIIWSQADLNSSQYPHVQKVWDLQARNMALVFSSTMEGKRSLFFEALNGNYVMYGMAGAGVIYAILSCFGLPTLLIFGVVRGLGQTNPAGLIPEFIGALIGRYYFQRKLGDVWLKYTPGIFAGFTCGVGLIGMISVALRLIAKAAMPLSF